MWVLDLAEVVSGASAVDAVVFNELAHTGIVPGPSITSDGILATSGADSMIRLWDIDTDELLLEFRSDLVERIAPVVFAPDGSYLLYPDAGVMRRLYLDPRTAHRAGPRPGHPRAHPR